MDSGDAIGIYALKSGQALSEQGIYNNKENIKHTTPGDGVFKPATEDITYPGSGSLDFIAYYPYKETIEDFKYKVNVSNQSKPAEIDLLYSNNAKDYTLSGDDVKLNFKHKLSQLILKTTMGDGVKNFDGLKVKVENIIVDGTMNLVDGVVSKGSTKGEITPVITSDSKSATAKAIVIPDQNLETIKITFTLDGLDFIWEPKAQDIESGKKYTIELELSKTGLVAINPNATIEDWEEGYTGADKIILTPDGEVTPDLGDSEGLLFPGADFEDWDLFLSGLSTHGIKHIQQADNGRNNSKSIHINTTPGGNDFIFTALVPNGFNPDGKNKIEFYIKGVSAKSLSVNVYKQGTGFAPFNLGKYSAEAVLEPSGNNQYNGEINTGGEWMKVTLDISSFDIITTPGESMFAIKVGKDAAYDLMIDDIKLVGDGGSTDPDPEPELSSLLFAGGDFEDWNAFTNGLNNYGLKGGYTAQSNNGRDGSKALHLNGTPSGNDYVFTALVPEGFSADDKNAIEFYIKGTGAKSLFLNVYKSDGLYQVYNLGDYSSELILEPAPNNQYGGTIDTGGKWLKVVLNISSLNIQTEVGKEIFALKVGKEAAYDLLVDDFVITKNSNATEPDPEPDLGNLLFPGSDFENWSAFTGSLSSFGLKAGYTSQSDNGRSGSKALYINGTPSGNDYVFTAVVPEGFSGAGKSKIEFYIKGTAAKSLSLNVYHANVEKPQMGTDYKCYNLATYTAPAVLAPTNSNAYGGTIDTGGDWMKVTLDISSLDISVLNKGSEFFALKVGKDAAYDLLVDDITIE